jgi:hypothetical protein
MRITIRSHWVQSKTDDFEMGSPTTGSSLIAMSSLGIR